MLSAEEICTRLGVSEKRGLDASMAARRLAKNGKNVISRPPNNLARKIFFYIFGGASGDSRSNVTHVLQVSGVFSSSRASSVLSPGLYLSFLPHFISMISRIQRRPLGEPNPFVPNLALAIVLLVVIAIQAAFNAWQGAPHPALPPPYLICSLGRLLDWSRHGIHRGPPSDRNPRHPGRREVQVRIYIEYNPFL